MKKRVLFIIWSFSYGGGAEKILSNVVNHMDPNQYEIDILEYYYVGIKKESINSNIYLYPPLINATKKDILSRIKNKLISVFITRCPKLIRKIYLNKVYDVEISFNYMIPTFLVNEKSTKKISWMHGSIYDLKENEKNRKLQEKSLEKFDKIVAISKRTYHSILEVFPQYESKTTIVHNGYEFEKIEKMAMEKVDTRLDMIFCGRLDENKNPLRMLKILSMVKEKGYDVKLGFLGVGELLPDLEKYVDDNNLTENVVFCGYQKNPYSYMKNSKILCMTSFSEGFPTVIIEGMVLGLPFVTTPVGGVDEMYDNQKCGFIADNDEDYRDSVIKLLNDKKLYSTMSEHCKEYVKQFSLDEQIRSLEELINGES